MGTENPSGNRNDNEDNKFIAKTDGTVAVDTVAEIDTSGTGPIEVLSGSIFSGIDYDSIGASYPDNVTEVYMAYEGGLAGTLVATVTVIYQNADKELITSVVRT